MTTSVLPLLRRAAACMDRALCTWSMRIAVIVAIVAAVSSSAHAAVPFEVKVTGTGPDVLLIPGLASSGERACMQEGKGPSRRVAACP